MDVLVENLLSGAKLRTFAPISQATFQDSDLISIATQELLLKVVADLMLVREDFFLTTKSVPIVGNVDRYATPKRAIANTAVALFYVDSSGSEHPLVRIDPSRRWEYASSGGVPSKMYYAGDEAVIVPKPTISTGSLLWQYYRKPNRLIATMNCAKVTGVSNVGGTTTFAVDTDLTNTALDQVLTVGSKIDILSASSPFLLWADEVEITNITPNAIEVSTDSVIDEAGRVEPQVGDYICPTGYSNIPMIPEEFHPALEQMIGVRLLSSLGDLNKLQFAKAELKEMRTEAVSMVKNRMQSSPIRVSRRNGLLAAFQR
jgi:hypothetical protein